MFDFRLKIDTRGRENKTNKLRQLLPTANFFTGSTSCSLLYLAALRSDPDDRLLFPTMELLSAGLAVYSGELGNVFAKNSINKIAISGCDIQRAENALIWSKSMAENRWIAESAQKKLIKLKHQIDYYAEQESIGRQIPKKLQDEIHIYKRQAKNIELQLNNYDHVNKQLIDEPFPIVYACQIKDGRAKYRGSDVSGEMTVVGGCTYDEVDAIFVPTDKIALVQSLLPKGQDKVRDIAILETTLGFRSEPEISPSSFM
ncbi:Uncharacterised protein [Legionella beliardensis]|uniref:Uncharacterized protein n=1 Tax=Legionella beliardensis TaxID=91822 RepID=A0A378I2G1_9GAMM|nr:hypothetical protein [Legionella beliardensis]STX28846.1 Uncharacterised protein [Legionella beliardensis]